MTIVHYEYRYKRPPRKKKPVALEVPAVVRAEPTRRPGNTRPADVDDDRKPAPASAIVTIRKPGKGYVPDLTPEEHQRRGDAAEALFREMKRRIATTKERRG
jgi:hypothetical protein